MGKDTLADILVTELPHQRLAFGDALKDLIGHYFDVSRNDIESFRGTTRQRNGRLSLYSIRVLLIHDDFALSKLVRYNALRLPILC